MQDSWQYGCMKQQVLKSCPCLVSLWQSLSVTVPQIPLENYGAAHSALTEFSRYLS